jgi:hypothetical protein
LDIKAFIKIGEVEHATGGIYINGHVDDINLDIDSNSNSRITITQGGSDTEIISVTEPFNLPSGSKLNGVDAGGQPIPKNTTLTKEPGKKLYTSYEGLPNGLLYVDGAINGLKGVQKGKMTIVSTGTITITDSIVYNDRDTSKKLIDDDIEDFEDSLGLVSDKDVKIAEDIPNKDLEIDAIIMAINTSFFYEGHRDYLKGDLTLLGGLIQKQRGPVGTQSGGKKTKGFSKQYYFDSRMASPASGHLPPYFPTTGKYQKIWWKEVN